MITVKGVTTTDQQETLDYYDKLAALYDGLTSPSCVRCSRVTTYIVIEPNEKSFLAGYKIRLDGLIFLTIKICWRCGAAEDGYRIGKYFAKDRMGHYSKLDELPFAPEELEEYKRIWSKAFEKGKLHMQEANDKSHRDRYKMK